MIKLTTPIDSAVPSLLNAIRSCAFPSPYLLTTYPRLNFSPIHIVRVYCTIHHLTPDFEAITKKETSPTGLTHSPTTTVTRSSADRAATWEVDTEPPPAL